MRASERLLELGVAIEPGKRTLYCGRDELLFFDVDGREDDLLEHDDVDLSEIDIYVDDNGRISRLMNDKSIQSINLEALIDGLLSTRGVAIIQPIRVTVLLSLVEQLNWMRQGGLDFAYRVELADATRNLFRLVMWNHLAKQSFAGDILAVNLSRFDVPEEVDESDYDRSSKEKHKEKYGPFWTSVILYTDLFPTEIAKGQKVHFLDQQLRIDYLDLKRISLENTVRGIRQIRAMLDANKSIKYVYTLTWLAKYVRRLGMRKVNRETSPNMLIQEANAINDQLLEVRNFQSGIERYFKPEDVAYWFCRADEFGVEFLKKWT